MKELVMAKSVKTKQRNNETIASKITKKVVSTANSVSSTIKKVFIHEGKVVNELTTLLNIIWATAPQFTHNENGYNILSDKGLNLSRKIQYLLAFKSENSRAKNNEGKTIGWTKKSKQNPGGTGWRYEGGYWTQYKNGRKTGRTSKTRLGTTTLSAHNPTQTRKGRLLLAAREADKKNTPTKNTVTHHKDTGHTKLVKGPNGKVRRVRVTDSTKDPTVKGSDTRNINTSGKPKTETKAETKPKSTSTVHTRHYKTGERLGVLTKRQRAAYEKEAAGRSFESEVAKYEKSSGHGKGHLRETLYKRSVTPGTSRYKKANPKSKGPAPKLSSKQKEQLKVEKKVTLTPDQLPKGNVKMKDGSVVSRASLYKKSETPKKKKKQDLNFTTM